jgi:hypothetical protein
LFASYGVKDKIKYELNEKQSEKQIEDYFWVHMNIFSVLEVKYEFLDSNFVLFYIVFLEFYFLIFIVNNDSS